MKKIGSVVCLLALACVVYLIVTAQPQDQRPTGTSAIDLEMDIDKARDKYEEISSIVAAEADEAVGDAIRQADEKLSSVTAQADEAIEDAVESAKDGFVESIKKSITEFFRNLTS